MRMGEAVVLVHGIWMSGIEMSLLRYRLQRCGYKTYQFHYASLRQTPAENAVALNRFLKKIKSTQIHLLAHSLGGIVLMHLFHRFPQQFLTQVKFYVPTPPPALIYLCRSSEDLLSWPL